MSWQVDCDVVERHWQQLEAAYRRAQFGLSLAKATYTAVRASEQASEADLENAYLQVNLARQELGEIAAELEELEDLGSMA